VGGTIAIIGAGIAGLATGCYAQMNGFSSQILEQGGKPGGLCARWTRGAYTIDGSVHWLAGAAPIHPQNRMWQELGVADISLRHHDAYLRIERVDGEPLSLYTDLNRLDPHLRAIAPEDAGSIGEFIGGVRRLRRLTGTDRGTNRLASELRRIVSGPSTARALATVRRWRHVTVEEFADGFEDAFLREAFTRVLALPDLSIVTLMRALASLSQGAAGYPQGGSAAVVDALAERYRSLGGTIEYDARVVEIQVRHDQAVGVGLEDGRSVPADVVVSAADGRMTLFDLLGERYLSPRLRAAYDSFPLFPPLLHVSFGVGRRLEERDATTLGIDFPLDKPVTIDQQRRTRLTAQLDSIDPPGTEAERTLIKVALPSDFSRWEALSENRADYEQAKVDAARQVLEALEQRFPRLAGDIEVTDVATPATWQRFTGNWQGSFAGWRPTPRTVGRRLPRELPALDRFYMAGHWVEPGGGLAAAARSGRDVARQICRARRQRFSAAVA
jgi:phytoene dehydrogenase-like protein